MRLVLAVMDRQGVRQAVLGGNSLGGEIAWNLALAAPSRVTKRILVDAAGYPLRPDKCATRFSPGAHAGAQSNDGEAAAARADRIQCA